MLMNSLLEDFSNVNNASLSLICLCLSGRPILIKCLNLVGLSNQ
ncbi:unnamed protein product [Prunus brigantina]